MTQANQTPVNVLVSMNTNQSTVVITELQRKEKSFRIEVVGNIVKPGSSVLSLLNEGDERFDNTSKRHAWMKVTPQAMHKYFGLSIEQMNSMKVGDVLPLNIENPKIAGQPLSIQITESQNASNEYEVINWKKVAKQVKVSDRVLSSSRMPKSSGLYDAAGEQGYFLKNGKLIFSNATVVVGEPKHSFVEGYTLSTEREAIAAVANGIQVATPVTEEVKAEAENVTSEI